MDSDDTKRKAVIIGAGRADAHRLTTLLSAHIALCLIAKPTPTIAERALELVPVQFDDAILRQPSFVVGQNAGVDAKQARRDQIRRNGGKR